MDITTISEPSILQLPCEASVICSNTQLKSSTSTKDKLAITSKLVGTCRKVPNFQYSIKTLTSRLESEYKERAIGSPKQLQINLYNSSPRTMKIFKMLGNLF
ncbi:unnamed protein product, partial [Rotaria sp. Silwood2]